MPSLNRVELIGHVGADPELKYTQSNVPVCNFSVATSWKSGDKEQTEWHRVVCWEKTAELAAQRLKKGHLVYVEGRIQTRQYEKEGEKRYATDIIANRVLFLERSKGVPTGNTASPGERAKAKPTGQSAVSKRSNEGNAGENPDDDIPF